MPGTGLGLHSGWCWVGMGKACAARSFELQSGGRGPGWSETPGRVGGCWAAEAWLPVSRLESQAWPVPPPCQAAGDPGTFSAAWPVGAAAGPVDSQALPGPVVNSGSHGAGLWPTVLCLGREGMRRRGWCSQVLVHTDWGTGWRDPGLWGPSVLCGLAHGCWGLFCGDPGGRGSERLSCSRSGVAGM